MSINKCQSTNNTFFRLILQAFSFAILNLKTWLSLLEKFKMNFKHMEVHQSSFNGKLSYKRLLLGSLFIIIWQSFIFRY